MAEFSEGQRVAIYGVVREIMVDGICVVGVAGWPVNLPERLVSPDERDAPPAAAPRRPLSEMRLGDEVLVRARFSGPAIGFPETYRVDLGPSGYTRSVRITEADRADAPPISPAGRAGWFEFRDGSGPFLLRDDEPVWLSQPSDAGVLRRAWPVERPAPISGGVVFSVADDAIVSAPESRLARVERLCRAMCAADGVDPDDEVGTGSPRLITGGFVIPAKDFTHAAWTLYRKYARAIVDSDAAS